MINASLNRRNFSREMGSPKKELLKGGRTTSKNSEKSERGRKNRPPFGKGRTPRRRKIPGPREVAFGNLASKKSRKGPTITNA